MDETLIGEIRLFAGKCPPTGWAFCKGQTLPINVNTALFSILGTQYGGNGTDNFQLPHLAPLKESDGGATPIQYAICLQGYYPFEGNYPQTDTTFMGQIRLFAGKFEPAGWNFCSGQTLPIQQNYALFSILKNDYGGDGQTNFQLPNLAPLKEVDGGQTLIRYIIAVSGNYPRIS